MNTSITKMEKRVNTVMSQKATENQTLLVAEPPTECHHNNTMVKDTVIENPFHSQIGTIICLPYLVRQVSKSWHALDGVLPKKGRTQSHDLCFCNKAMKWCLHNCTNPAYDHSLGYSSRQSYKLFKVFEQPWIEGEVHEKSLNVFSFSENMSKMYGFLETYIQKDILFLTNAYPRLLVPHVCSVY